VPQSDEETQERRTHMKRRGFHDDEERDLITAYESREFRPVKDQQKAKQTAIQTARRYMRKDARVNIRRPRDAENARWGGRASVPKPNRERAPQIRQRQSPTWKQGRMSLNGAPP